MSSQDTIPEHERGYFTEADSVEVVVGRNAKAKDERLKAVMEVVTRHLHEAVKEIEPTPGGMDDGHPASSPAQGTCATTGGRNGFCCRTRWACPCWSTAINSRRPSGASENTVLGPFHVEELPELEMGADICLDDKGERMFVHGRILDTEGNPIEGVKIDVWQANDEGFYDVQQKGHPARLQLARRLSHRQRWTLFFPRGEAEVLSRFPPTARSGNCSTGWAGIPCARRISTTSSPRTATTR